MIAAPIPCMHAMRLGSIHHYTGSEERWVGSFAGVDGTPYYIEVDRLPTVRAAATARKRASDIYAANAHRYLVTGPARWRTPGATTDQVDGEMAQLAVLGVQACLARSGG